MYKSFVSLETRLLLLTGVKAFCSCGYPPGGKPETCPICRRESASAPSLNEEAAVRGYLAAKALGCELVLDPPYEKHLGSPETPPDRPLSGYSVLLGRNGSVETVFHGKKTRVRIAEVRIEEDAGRLVHSAGGAVMDYGHAGMPSLRIRTEADLEIGEEAELFLQELWARLSYLGVSTGEPKEALVRCNAYVALTDLPELGREYVKLRNLNSFNFVRKAINFELGRQEELLERGEAYESESRLWNEAKSVTEGWQKRRADPKGRFAAAADLAPFATGAGLLGRIERGCAELPERRALRFMRDYAINRHQARHLTADRARADWFEACVGAGAAPEEAAHWMISDLAKALRNADLPLAACPLAPARFAWILAQLAARRIHGPAARRLIFAAVAEGRDPEELLAERGWDRRAGREDLGPIVDAVLAERGEELERIAAGETKPVHRLIGEALARSGDLADPALIRELIAERLNLSFLHVISMGGAISGARAADGAIVPGGEEVLRELLQSIPCPAGVRLESALVGKLRSEEVAPADWAALIALVAEALASGSARGIVVTHGIDTLPYTAALLHWLFADAGAPIVLTASASAPCEGAEARDNLARAVALAGSGPGGVHVSLGEETLSPLNLKFLAAGPGGFRNWNSAQPAHSGPALHGSALDADRYVVTQLLEELVDQTCVVKVYPGMKGDFLIALMNAGARYIVLELYEAGAANLREGAFSLRKALLYGKRRGVRFFCTSQQEGLVDFSRPGSSRELWKGGAIPMGSLTTESAYARLLAAALIAESDEELVELMEERA